MRLGKPASTKTYSADFGLPARTAKTPYAHDPASPGRASIAPGLFLIVADWVTHVAPVSFPLTTALRRRNPVIHLLAGHLARA